MNYPYIEVPLANELFDCQQGDLSNKHPADKEDGKVYHTYLDTVVGSVNDNATLANLRSRFETYLRRLHANTSGEGKPKLFWRFRIGVHIAIESGGTKKKPLVQLRTRLVVPDCTLIYCPTCHRTEGETHQGYCENVVRNNHG